MFLVVYSVNPTAPRSSDLPHQTCSPALSSSLHQSPKNHTRPNVNMAHAGGATVAIPVRNVAKFLISARIFAVFLYRSRNTIERMFGRLKDFRRIAIRYDHLAPNFVAVVCLAAAVSAAN